MTTCRSCGGAQGEEGNSDGDDSSNDSQPESFCMGCQIGSKGMCPISEMLERPVRVTWARHRKLKKRTARGTENVKVPSGGWCRNCYNLWRSHFQEECQELNTLASKLHDKAFCKKWHGRRKKWVKQKGGGSVRIRGPKQRVQKTNKYQVDLEDPEKEFWTLAAYEEEYGSVKDTKAKVVALPNKAGELIKGVVVQKGRQGCTS